MTRSLVVGAGSIGTRHVRVLGDLGHEVAAVTRRTDLTVRRFADLDAAVADFAPDYVVIATETAHHAASVRALTATGFSGALLVEKPMAVPADELDVFSRVGIGFNLRFHPVIARAAELLADADIHTVEVYAGQHLTQWRPDRPAAEQYSASRVRGGGALRDLSHEFDYLGWMLGACRGAFARGGRLGDVTVDADDAWGIVAEYDRAPIVTVQLNYLDTRARRRIVATTSAGTVEADVVAGTVEHDGGREHLAIEQDASYKAMHEAMIAADGPVATAHDGAQIERVIALLEVSAAEARWVAA